MELEDEKISHLRSIFLEIIQELLPQINFSGNPNDFQGEQREIWHSFVNGIPEDIIEKYAYDEISEINKKDFKADLVQFLGKSQESLNVYARMKKLCQILQVLNVYRGNGIILLF